MLNHTTRIPCGWLSNVQPKPCHHSQLVQGLEEIEATGPLWNDLCFKLKILFGIAFLQPQFWHNTWKNRKQLYFQCRIMQPGFNVACWSMSTKTMSSLSNFSRPWRDRSYRSWKLLVSPAFLQEWFWHKTWKNRINFHLQCRIIQPRFNVEGQSMYNQNHVITPNLINALNRSYWSLMDLSKSIYLWVFFV